MIKVNTEELNAIYQYDLEMLELEDEISRAIDNVENSFGTDGLPAAIRHLTTLSQSCLDNFNQRKEVIVKMGESEIIEEMNPIEEMKKDENEEK